MNSCFAEAVQAVDILHKEAAARLFQSMAGFPEIEKMSLLDFIPKSVKDLGDQELVLSASFHF